MPTLENITGASLAPSGRDAFNIVKTAFKEKELKKDKERKQRIEDEDRDLQKKIRAQLQQNVDIVAGKEQPVPGEEGKTAVPTEEQKTAARLQIATLAPQVSQAIDQAISTDNKLAQEQIKQEAEKGLRMAIPIKNLKTHGERINALVNVAKKKLAAGEDTSRIMTLINLPEKSLDIALDQMIATGQAIDTLVPKPVVLSPGQKQVAPGGQVLAEVPPKPERPVVIPQGAKAVDPATRETIAEGQPKPTVAASPEGKLAQDLKNGIIDQPTFRNKIKKLAELKNGKAFAASAKSEILADGTAVLVMPDGSTKVLDPSGKEVTGQERLDAIRNAQQAEIDLAGVKAGTKKAAEAAIKQSGEAIESIQKINTNIGNMNDAIQAIDDGAATGPIVSRLPSFRQASILLDNIQARMGLDVIGNTTFGALSENELKFALSSALPKSLKPKALREWLVKKRDAQQKLADYLESAAIFLGTPGATPAEWIKLQKQLREQQKRESGAGKSKGSISDGKESFEKSAKDLKELSDDDLLKRF